MPQSAGIMMLHSDFRTPEAFFLSLMLGLGKLRRPRTTHEFS